MRTSLTMSRDPLDLHTRFILDLATERATGMLYSDQYRCPIGVDDLGGAILELATDTFAGVINIAGADAVSRYDLGLAVSRAYHIDAALLRAGQIPVELASTVVAMFDSISRWPVPS